MSPPPWKATFQVALKELRSSFRDRQTVIYTVVLPLALYPAVLWCLVQGALLVQGRDERAEVGVGLAAERPTEVPPGLRVALEEPARESSEGPAYPVRVDAGAGGLPRSEAQAWMEAATAPDAVLWIPASPDGAGEGTEGAEEVRADSAEIFYDATRHDSQLALGRVKERVEPYATDLRRRALIDRGASPELLVPFEVEYTNVAPQRDMLAYVLSFVLPMLLVVMCVMGAFFPAVDLTAGEKERSTAETTLLLPVPRIAVLHGKILAVCFSAVLATALNLAAIGLSVGHLLGMLSGGALPPMSGFPVLALFAVAPLALLFSFFVSAVLTGAAALAKSFEEGQALLGPVQILFIVPALVGVIPGIHLTVPLCFVPVVNVSLAFRSMLLGEGLSGEYSLVALSLLLYGLLSTRAAVLLLSRESVSLGGLSVSRLIGALRSPSREGSHAG